MILLLRFFLISLIIYLIIRSFIRYGETNEETERKFDLRDSNFKKNKRISKEVGEYTDYEEVKK